MARLTALSMTEKHAIVLKSSEMTVVVVTVWQFSPHEFWKHQKRRGWCSRLAALAALSRSRAFFDD